jgi:aminobenzoyl-glutamate transport protein
MEEIQPKQNWVDRFLNGVEKVCDKLPPPAILFCFLFVLTAIAGALLTASGLSLVNPANGKVVTAQNLFSPAGVDWLLKNMVKNFSGFAPLGLVITMTLAIGFCEESGLLVSLLRRSMKDVPPGIVPYLIAFVGTLGNIASDTAAVVIPPLAALVYIGVGKNPLAGMIVGYAGANAGFTANLMIAGTDTLLQGLTNQALEGFLGKGAYAVDVTCNWYFMAASTFLVALVLGYASQKIVEPRFAPYEARELEAVQDLTTEEKRGLHNAGLVSLVYLVLIAVGFFTGILSRDGHTLVGSLLLKGLIPILFFLMSLAGIAYGLTTKKFKTVKDINGAMVKQMSHMGSYVVFCFFCGQFQGLFNWSHMGTLLAIGGADFLKGLGFTGMPLCVVFVLVCAFVNIFMSSGSAKWAIFAPIFVPMFMLLGYHPAFAQLLYRLGDSPGNSVTPMMPYLWMMLSVAQEKYDPKCTVGTFISNLIPLAVILQIAWILFMMIWVGLNIPLGPGVTVHLPAGIL